MPQGHAHRAIARWRRVLMCHGRTSDSKRRPKRTAISTWNLRRLGQGVWGGPKLFDIWGLDF